MKLLALGQYSIGGGAGREGRDEGGMRGVPQEEMGKIEIGEGGGYEQLPTVPHDVRY